MKTTEQKQEQEQARHTPGPWLWQGTAGHEQHGQSAVYSEETGKTVALVYSKENARLIAAAPELLEALKGLMADWDELRDWCGPTLDQARAAIARAEGGAS